MKKIIWVTMIVLLCTIAFAQEGTHIIFDEDTVEKTITFATYTQSFNVTDNITIQSDLSILPIEGNIVNIAINITKPTTDDYFIYELKDTEHKLTSIIERISFNVPPIVIKDGELAWRIAGDATDILIQGSVAPASPFSLEEENNTFIITPTDLEQNSRKPKVSERISLGVGDRIALLQQTMDWKQIFMILLVAAGVLGLMWWYYRKRSTLHDKITKPEAVTL